MNNPKSSLVALIVAVSGVIGCNSNTSNPAATAPASLSTPYTYTAYDPGGAVVATGTLTLAFDQSAVEGQRDIKGTAPEAGKGAISGQELADGTLQIELNPASTAVVILHGKFQGTGITGTRLLDAGDPPLDRTIGTFTIYPSSTGTR